jgi:hypothetical protein
LYPEHLFVKLSELCVTVALSIECYDARSAKGGSHFPLHLSFRDHNFPRYPQKYLQHLQLQPYFFIQLTAPPAHTTMADSEGDTSAQVSSSDRREHGSFPLAIATLPDLPPSNAQSTEAEHIASRWVKSFNAQINTTRENLIANDFSDLFLAESYWRDILCLTWDFHTLHRPEGISSVFRALSGKSCVRELRINRTSTHRSPKAVLNEARQLVTVQAYLVVRTHVGIGEGFVQLKDVGGTWKAFTLFTCLKELRGHEELVGKRRPHGAQYTVHQNWLDCREREENFDDDKLAVLIVGMFTLS